MEIKKKIICVIVGAILMFGLGYGTSYLIYKINYTRSTSRLEQLLGTGHVSSTELYNEIERRITEFDTITEQFNGISDGIDNCSDLAEQSGLAIGQLRGTVEELGVTNSNIGVTSSNIGDTIKQLKEEQRRFKTRVGVFEENNSKPESQLKELQGSTGQQQR